MNKKKFSCLTYYRFIKIGILLFLTSPLNLVLAIFLEGPSYQWPFRLFFISLCIIGLVLGFVLFWYLLFATIYFYGKKDPKGGRTHLVHFLLLALLPLLLPFLVYTLDFIQSGFQFPPSINFSNIYYPAGGAVYTEFLPLVFDEFKNVLTDPSYTIPIFVE